ELAAGGTLDRLQLSPQPGGGTTLLRVAGDRLLSATVDPAFLWDDPGDMSQAMRICMYAGGRGLFCGGHPGTEAGDRLLTAHWELFLEAGFGAQPWTAVAVSGPGHGFGHYRGVLVPAAIAVLLLAVLLSSIQIRRVLVPLADLLRRIQGIEGGEARIGRQAGEDEFDLLSRTFGRLQQRLGRQMDTLRMLSGSEGGEACIGCQAGEGGFDPLWRTCGRMQQRIGRQMDTLRMLSDIDRLIVQGAPLQALIDQVAVAMRGLAGCRNVCVVVSGQPGQAHAALFELAREAGRTRRIDCVEDCPGGTGAPAAASGQWHPVARLAPGCVREACVRDGIDEVFVLETASRPDRIQV